MYDRLILLVYTLVYWINFNCNLFTPGVNNGDMHVV